MVRHQTLVPLVVLVLVGTAAAAPLDPPPVPWIDEEVRDGIVSFLYSHPPRIERYDLDLGMWLTQVQLPRTPSSFAVGEDAYYVGFRTGEASRFDHDGGNELPFPAHSSEVDEVFVSGDFVYTLDRDDTMMSAYRATGVGVDSRQYIHPMRGFHPASGLGRAYAMIAGTIGYVELLPFGILGGQVYSSDQPIHFAERAWVFPDETLAVDDSGLLVHADDLATAAGLGGEFDDLGFYGEVPIMLRGDRIVAYSPAFVRTGEIATGLYGRRIVVYGDRVAVIHLGAAGVEVAWFPVLSLHPAPPDEPVRPEGLSNDIDAVALDDRNIVYLLSRDHHSVFRFSVDEGRYLDTIPLAGGAKYMTYVHDWDRLYLGYHLGQITAIQLAPDGTPSAETPHLTTDRQLHRLATTGDYLLVADYLYANSVLHTTFDQFGTAVSQTPPDRYRSERFEWCGATRRLYYMSIGISPIDLYYESIDVNGHIGPEVDSPYHGGNYFLQPIRARADGEKVLLGKGHLFDGATLDLEGDLGSTHIDALWWGTSMLTLAESGSDAELRLYDPDLVQQDAATLVGTPIALLPVAADALVVSTEENRPRFSHWNQDLDSGDLRVVVTDGQDIVDGGSVVTFTATIDSRGSDLAGVHVTGSDSGQLGDLEWNCASSTTSACGAASGTGALDDVAYIAPDGVVHYEIIGTVRTAAAGTLQVTAVAQPPTGRAYEDSDLTEVHSADAIFSDDFESGGLDAWSAVAP